MDPGGVAPAAEFWFLGEATSVYWNLLCPSWTKSTMLLIPGELPAAYVVTGPLLAQVVVPSPQFTVTLAIVCAPLTAQEVGPPQLLETVGVLSPLKSSTETLVVMGLAESTQDRLTRKVGLVPIERP